MDSIFKKYKDFKILTINYDSLQLTHNLTLSKLELQLTKIEALQSLNKNLTSQTQKYKELLTTKDKIHQIEIQDLKMQNRRYLFLGAGVGSVITLLLVLL